MTPGEVTALVVALGALSGTIFQWWRGGSDANGLAAAKWMELFHGVEARLTAMELQNGRYRSAFEFLCVEVLPANPTAVRVARQILDGKITVNEDGVKA